MNDSELRTIENIVLKFYNKFRFGFFEADDIKQEIRIFCLEALGRFDPNKGTPLENFLTIHVRNRLLNFKRDNYTRTQKPCHSCPFYDPHLERSSNQCSEFVDKMECGKYKNWYGRNLKKRNLSNASGGDGSTISANSPFVGEDPETKELWEIIKERLPVGLRSDLLRLLDGVTISKGRRIKVEEAVRKIMEELK